MHTGFAQPSFGYKTSSRGSLRQDSLKKPPQPASPLFGRATEVFPYFDTFHPEPKKKKDKAVIVQVYNGAPNPNEKPSLLSTCRKAAQDTIQTVKNIAFLTALAGLGYGAYRLAPTAIAGGKAIWNTYQAIPTVQDIAQGAQEVGKNAVKEVKSPRNLLSATILGCIMLGQHLVQKNQGLNVIFPGR